MHHYARAIYQTVKEIVNVGKGYFSIEVEGLGFFQSTQQSAIAKLHSLPAANCGQGSGGQQHTTFCACVYNRGTTANGLQES
jgi:hypothetical protein